MNKPIEFTRLLGEHMTELSKCIETYARLYEAKPQGFPEPSENAEKEVLQDSEEGPAHFTISTKFLNRCFPYILQQREETLAYISGVNTGTTVVLDELVTFDLEKQEVAYVKGNIVSSSAALIGLSNTGYCLLGTIHNHPGLGHGATTPSHIDYAHHRRLEAGGHRALGIIITRDGFVRFYTGDMPYTVDVVGSDGEWVSENTYKLVLDESEHIPARHEFFQKSISKVLGCSEEVSHD